MMKKNNRVAIAITSILISAASVMEKNDKPVSRVKNRSERRKDKRVRGRT